MKCRGCGEDDFEDDEICGNCHQCDWCCGCDDEALFDADELGLDPEEDTERA
jgi:hypothetical protein